MTYFNKVPLIERAYSKYTMSIDSDVSVFDEEGSDYFSISKFLFVMTGILAVSSFLYIYRFIEILVEIYITLLSFIIMFVRV